MNWQHIRWLALGMMGCALGFYVGSKPKESSVLPSTGKGESEHRTVPLSGNAKPSLGELNQLVNFYAFSYALHKRVQQFDKTTIVTLLDEFRSIQPSKIRYNETARALLCRLAELSPDDAVDFCSSYTDDNQPRYRFLTIVAEAIARTNIDRALAIMPARSDNRLAWLAGLVEGVEKDGMNAVLPLLGEANVKLRQRLMERFDPNPSGQCAALMNPSKASADLAEIEDPSSRSEALNKLLEKVGPIDLSTAVALIRDHSDLDWYLNGMFVIAPFRLRPEQTIGKILTLPPGERRDELLSDCLLASTGISTDIARAVAGAIDDEDKRAEAVRQHFLQISLKDPDAAVQLAAAYGLKEGLENELHVRALHKQISDGDPEGALASIARLSDRESQESLLLSVIRSMTPGWGNGHSSYPKGREAEVLEKILPLAASGDHEIPRAIGDFLQIWIEEDVAAALQATTSNLQLKSVQAETWNRAAANDPIQVIEEALQTGDATIGEAALNGGIKALAGDDPQVALDILHAVLNSPEQSNLVNSNQANAVGTALAHQLPLEEVWQWANSLPENLRNNAALAATAEAIADDFTTARTALLALPPSDLKNDALARLAGSIGAADPAQAFTILNELPVTPDSARRMERILRDWEEIDADSAAAAAEAYRNR